MSVSLLFYSNFCNHCKQIVNEINKSPVRNSVRYVCIDNQSVRSKLPTYITSVPALVVGDTNQIFVGNQISGWLKMVPIIKRKASAPAPRQVATAQHVPQQQKAQKNQEPEGPSAWHCNEMSSFSDMYSFIGIDGSAEGDGGMSMVHNFETLNGCTANIPGSAPGGAPGRGSMPVQYENPVANPSGNSSYGSIQQSAKTDALNKSMEEMMQRRELDVPNVPTRM